MPAVAMHKILTLALGLALLPASVASSKDEYLSFVACPVARDRGPWRDVCFIVRHGGQNYALLNPADWGEPQLRHRVLIEGRVVPGREHCDAVLLEGRLSVLREVDNTCNEIIPYTGPVEPQPEQNLIGNVSEDPEWQGHDISVRPVMNQVPDSPPLQGPPYRPQEKVIYFPFDSDRGSGPDMADLVVLVDYAVAANAVMQIVTYQGSSKIDNDRALFEKREMAKQRAQKLQSIVLGLGLEPENLRVDWNDDHVPGDGAEDWRGRRAEIQVHP
ncbi:MAG TPA: hypothetical protein VF389_01030 [Woeseiaceae bacterium]